MRPSSPSHPWTPAVAAFAPVGVQRYGAPSGSAPCASDLAQNAICPIGHTALREESPAALYHSVVDGQIYIRANLKRWLCNHNTSPWTREHAHADIDRLFPEGRPGRHRHPKSTAILNDLCGMLVGLGIAGMTATSMIGQALVGPLDPNDPEGELGLSPGTGRAVLAALFTSAIVTLLGVTGFELLRRHALNQQGQRRGDAARFWAQPTSPPSRADTPEPPRHDTAWPDDENQLLLSPQRG